MLYKLFVFQPGTKIPCKTIPLEKNHLKESSVGDIIKLGPNFAPNVQSFLSNISKHIRGDEAKTHEWFFSGCKVAEQQAVVVVKGVPKKTKCPVDTTRPASFPSFPSFPSQGARAPPSVGGKEKKIRKDREKKEREKAAKEQKENEKRDKERKAREQKEREKSEKERKPREKKEKERRAKEEKKRKKAPVPAPPAPAPGPATNGAPSTAPTQREPPAYEATKAAQA